MRHPGLYLTGVLLIGGLFWPWLLVFAGMVAVIAVVAAVLRVIGGKR